MGEAANMSFQFVEVNKIDAAARRLIRSHVMKGKNKGKSRPQDNRANLPLRTLAPAGHGNTSGKFPAAGMADTISIPPTIGDNFSCLTFPCILEPYMKDLIQHFISVNAHAAFPPEICLPSVAFRKSTWFDYLQKDQAFFHSVLALSEVSMDSLAGRCDTSPRALQNLSNTYRCISRNLQTEGKPSDQTAIAVVSMAIHDDLRGQPERSKLHINAIQRIVELRGGILGFLANPLLFSKICRADIEYALHDGLYPRFYRDEFPRKLIQSMLNQSGSEKGLSILAEDVPVDDPDIRCVVLDAVNFTLLLNSDPNIKIHPFVFQEALISVLYRLLYSYPLAGTRPESEIDNVYRLGTIALMATFLFQYGQTRRLSSRLLSEKIRYSFEDACQNQSVDESILLWLLFVSGISVAGAINRTWVLARLKTCLFNLNIDSWHAAHEMIQRFPWIDAVHNKAGKELWKAVVWK